MRVDASAAALIGALGLAACGAGGVGSAGGAPITDDSIDAVVRLFRAEGVELRVSSDRTTDLLGRVVTMAPHAGDEAAHARFGRFEVSVLELDRWLALGLFEGDLHRVRWEPQVPEEDEQHEELSWTASSFYGRNVHLIWRTSRRELDVRWRRLDGLLRRLGARPAGAAASERSADLPPAIESWADVEAAYEALIVRFPDSESAGPTGRSLSQPQRDLVLLLLVDAEINNGGFAALMYNSTGRVVA